MASYVESFEEAQAESAAWQRFREDQQINHHSTAAFRFAWAAGRDWQREQAALAGDRAGKVERLREALARYADENNYGYEELYSDDPSLRAKGVTYRSKPIIDDDGERARAALAEPDEQEAGR